MPDNLPLNQHGLVDLEVFLHGLDVGKRHGGPLGLVFDELVVHQMFAHQVNVEIRILHLPDLAGFQGLERDSTFLLHLYVRLRVPEQVKESNANRTAAKLIEYCRVWRHSPAMQTVFTGPVFVVRDNIDTDQIIPAQYLNLVPTIPEEY